MRDQLSGTKNSRDSGCRVLLWNSPNSMCEQDSSGGPFLNVTLEEAKAQGDAIYDQASGLFCFDRLPEGPPVAASYICPPKNPDELGPDPSQQVSKGNPMGTQLPLPQPSQSALPNDPTRPDFNRPNKPKDPNKNDPALPQTTNMDSTRPDFNRPNKPKDPNKNNPALPQTTGIDLTQPDVNQPNRPEQPNQSNPAVPQATSMLPPV